MPSFFSFFPTVVWGSRLRSQKRWTMMIFSITSIILNSRRFLYSIYDDIRALSYNLGPKSKPEWAISISVTFSENVMQNLSQINWFLVVVGSSHQILISSTLPLLLCLSCLRRRGRRTGASATPAVGSFCARVPRCGFVRREQGHRWPPRGCTSACAAVTHPVGRRPSTPTTGRRIQRWRSWKCWKKFQKKCWNILKKKCWSTF